MVHVVSKEEGPTFDSLPNYQQRKFVTGNNTTLKNRYPSGKEAEEVLVML